MPFDVSTLVVVPLVPVAFVVLPDVEEPVVLRQHPFDPDPLAGLIFPIIVAAEKIPRFVVVVACMEVPILVDVARVEVALLVRVPVPAFPVLRLGRLFRFLGRHFCSKFFFSKPPALQHLFLSDLFLFRGKLVLSKLFFSKPPALHHLLPWGIISRRSSHNPRRHSLEEMVRQCPVPFRRVAMVHVAALSSSRGNAVLASSGQTMFQLGLAEVPSAQDKVAAPALYLCIFQLRVSIIYTFVAVEWPGVWLQYLQRLLTPLLRYPFCSRRPPFTRVYGGRGFRQGSCSLCSLCSHRALVTGTITMSVHFLLFGRLAVPSFCNRTPLTPFWDHHAGLAYQTAYHSS